MNANRGPPVIGASFTRRRRRYGHDLQPCQRTRFSTSCVWNVYNDPWKRAVWSTISGALRLRRLWKRAQTAKKRHSYKAVNCLRCSISLWGTAWGPASETTVKSLIDDLYVNAGKSRLPSRASPFTWDSIAVKRVTRAHARLLSLETMLETAINRMMEVNEALSLVSLLMVLRSAIYSM